MTGMRASRSDMSGEEPNEVLDWPAVASEAMDELRDVRHGERGQRLDVLARKHGLAAQTVRRLIAAKRFLDALTEQEPELARDLGRHSFAAVEAVDRWWRRDPLAARKTAVRFVAERWTVRQMLAAESSAPGSGVAANRMPRIVAKHIAEVVIAKVGEQRNCTCRIIWAAAPYTVALDRERVEQPFMRHLRDMGLSAPGIAFILRAESDSHATDIAVAIVRDDPERSAFGAVAMLAGLSFARMEGLLVGFEPERAGWWIELSSLFRGETGIGTLMLEPAILLRSGKERQKAES